MEEEIWLPVMILTDFGMWIMCVACVLLLGRVVTVSIFRRGVIDPNAIRPDGKVNTIRNNRSVGMDIWFVRRLGVGIRENGAGYVVGYWLVTSHVCNGLSGIFAFKGALVEYVSYLKCMASGTL